MPRKNLLHFQNTDFQYALILSGISCTRWISKGDRGACRILGGPDVATLPVIARDASSLGILQVNGEAPDHAVC